MPKSIIYAKSDDGELMERVKQKDREAFVEVMHRYQNRLRSMLSIYCRSADEVEDFLQEALVRAYLKADQFKKGSPVFPWLKTIALNVLRKEVRRLKYRSQVSEDYLRYLQLVQLDDEDDLAYKYGDALAYCVERLPSRQKGLLQARYKECLTTEQMAESFNSTRSAVKQKLYRLRELLRKCVETRVKTDGVRV